MRVFKARRWPQVAPEEADLLGQLIDEFLQSPTDIGPSVHELAKLSGSQPTDPDRPIWLWLAEWSSTTGDLDEPLLALKIAAFTLAWRNRATAGPAAALLHPLDPASSEFTQIQLSALSAARQLSDGTAFRDKDDLTVERLTAYLYGPHSRSMGRGDRRPPPVDRRYAGLGEDRLSLLEYRCGTQWATFLELLEPGEQVRAAAPVMSFDLRVSLLALTDHRLIVVSAGKFLLGTATYAETDLADVLTVRYHPGSQRAAAMAGSGVKDTFRSLRQLTIESRSGDFSVNFRIHGVPKNEGAEWPTLILRQKRARPEAPAQQPSPPTATPDLAGQLEKLGQLRRDGILSETEFAAAKARLLG